MSKAGLMRFSKNTIARTFAAYLGRYEDEYRAAAGKPYNSQHGTAQIPEGNTDAAVAYGAIDAIETLWDELRLPDNWGGA